MALNNFGFIQTNNEKWTKIDFSKITHITAYGKKSSVIYFSDEKRLICNKSLFILKTTLPVYFERVHKLFIVNINCVELIDLNLNIVSLNNEQNISISESYIYNLEWYLIHLRKAIRNPSDSNFNDLVSN